MTIHLHLGLVVTETHIPRNYSVEHLARFAVRAKDSWKNPEVRAKRIEGMKRAHARRKELRNVTNA